MFRMSGIWKAIDWEWAPQLPSKAPFYANVPEEGAAVSFQGSNSSVTW